MNYIGWTLLNIAVRCIWYKEQLCVNVSGETYPCEILGPGDNDRGLGYVDVKYEGGKLRIPLSLLSPLGDNQSLFYFETSYPDGLGGTLYIPPMAVCRTDDEAEEEE